MQINRSFKLGFDHFLVEKTPLPLSTPSTWGYFGSDLEQFTERLLDPPSPLQLPPPARYFPVGYDMSSLFLNARSLAAEADSSVQIDENQSYTARMIDFKPIKSLSSQAEGVELVFQVDYVDVNGVQRTVQVSDKYWLKGKEGQDNPVGYKTLLKRTASFFGLAYLPDKFELPSQTSEKGDYKKLIGKNVQVKLKKEKSSDGQISLKIKSLNVLKKDNNKVSVAPTSTTMNDEQEQTKTKTKTYSRKTKASSEESQAASSGSDSEAPPSSKRRKAKTSKVEEAKSQPSSGAASDTDDTLSTNFFEPFSVPPPLPVDFSFDANPFSPPLSPMSHQLTRPTLPDAPKKPKKSIKASHE